MICGDGNAPIVVCKGNKPVSGTHGVSGFSILPQAQPPSSFSGFSTQLPAGMSLIPPEKDRSAAPWFKCKFCRGKRFAKCTAEQLEGFPRLCGYGTVLSIYKWAVRVVVLVGGLLTIGWAANTLFVQHEAKDTFFGTIAVIILVLVALAILGFCVYGIARMQEQLGMAGGRVWGREETDAERKIRTGI